MELKELYSLRNDFTIIGLTGQTGSGCSKIAEILCSDYRDFEKGLRASTDFDDPIFIRKYSICKHFLGHGKNWVKFDLIKYTDVLFFHILHTYGGDYKHIKQLFQERFKENSSEDNNKVIRLLLAEIIEIDREYTSLINDIKSLKDFSKIKSKKKLLVLEKLFFGEDFKRLKDKIFDSLERYGYFRTRILFHWTANNLRRTGDPLINDPSDVKNIYTIAKLINALIKAKKTYNLAHKKPTKIVIDSLRNSLELLFFKERYSAFYMVAMKDVLDNSKIRISARLRGRQIPEEEIELLSSKIIELDATEYKTNDFQHGQFSSPDVENCIQKSDYHIYNLKKTDLIDFAEKYFDKNINGFYSREEQLLKLLALIQKPGLITPSSAERAMQIAHTAKLNSGCVSRRVGAVITDKSFSIKSVGWNDVPKGQTPCNLRCFNDFKNINIDSAIGCHYSDFEKGKFSVNASFKYKGDKLNDFPKIINDYLGESVKKNSKHLNGRNIPFCFKTIHNFYEGEANQVHTKSLHAEENAMLQITKNGGTSIKGGFLFTTASPCELCSKKAFQIGIERIYFIDPYPGISKEQIIKCGEDIPVLIPFLGAIGNTYYKLYDLFTSQKDEIAMILEIDKGQNLTKKFCNVLSQKKHKVLIERIKSSNFSDEEIIEIFETGINQYKRKIVIE